MQTSAGTENVLFSVACQKKGRQKNYADTSLRVNIYTKKHGCELKYVLSYNVNQIPEPQRGKYICTSLHPLFTSATLAASC